MDTTVEAQRESSPSRLQQLPDELKQTILACLQDVFSLRSAVLSCRSLHSAFLSVETSITTRVLVDHINPTVLSDAIARQESLSIDPLNHAMVRKFIQSRYDKFVKDTHRWDLRSALSIAKFHRLILYYTERFVRDSSAFFPARNYSPFQHQMSVTASEAHRIQRAFYRYETFCNIFRNKGHSVILPMTEDFTSMKLQDIFLSRFAPWENEQLACVYAFLVDQVSPVYNEMAEHDVEYGSCEIEWGAHGITEASGHFQFLLSTGLDRLRNLIRAETYVQQKKLMPRPRWREQFIRTALKRINGLGSHSDRSPLSDEIGDCDTPLNRLTEEDKITYITAPFFDDPDPGPADVWAWASWGSTPFGFVNFDHQKPCQRWGYVMWDSARLRISAVFREQFQYPVVGLSDLRRERQQKERLLDEHRGSNNARKQIYDEGGRGWWSKNDRSRLVWVEVVKN